MIAPVCRASRGMQHAENPHLSWARVLDAVDLPGREVEAGSRSKRRFTAVDVGDSLPRDDVADLVVRMAVKRSLARLDDAEELRDVVASRLFVDEVAELPFLGRLE